MHSSLNKELGPLLLCESHSEAWQRHKGRFEVAAGSFDMQADFLYQLSLVFCGRDTGTHILIFCCYLSWYIIVVYKAYKVHCKMRSGQNELYSWMLNSRSQTAVQMFAALAVSAAIEM